MNKYLFVEALDDSLPDDSTVYIFRFEDSNSGIPFEFIFNSMDRNCLYNVLYVTARLLGHELEEVSTDDFFALAAGYELVEDEFLIDSSNFDQNQKGVNIFRLVN